ncbi:MAG: hypothetical protein H7833_03420 [Magnetococcus sp. DMHC-1]|nr:hypothetical protein [Magnetococcales bacterium]
MSDTPKIRLTRVVRSGTAKIRLTKAVRISRLAKEPGISDDTNNLADQRCLDALDREGIEHG